MQRINRFLLAGAVGFVVVSCGVGTSSTAGIDRGGVVSGPVTGYGSVWVNGERYATSGADISVNGQPATEAELAVGQVVLLDALISASGLSAERVRYESNLQGPVSDLLAGSFMALGQKILVDTGTTFGIEIVPADLSGLTVGDIVEVSGLTDTLGQIRATRIDKKSAPYELQLSGVVSAAVANQSFKINDQLVVYDHPDFAGDAGQPFPGGQPVNGDAVRVIVADSATAKFGAAGEILATTVAYRGPVADVEEGEEGEIEGLVNCPAAGPCNPFSLAGFNVLTNAQTEYSGGTAADLADNIRIEADGVFDAAGTLIADEIEFREEGESAIEAVVDSVNAAQSTVVVFGVEVMTTPLTRIEDKRDELRPFGLGNLLPGDFLKIEGSWDGDKVIATRLERLEGEDKYQLSGPLTAPASPNFSLLGKLVQTDAATTDYEVNDIGGKTVSEFFDAVALCLPTAEGCQAGARWDPDVSLFIADEVELED